MELDSGELVEVGAHTVTHPLLHNQPPATQRTEIADSRSYLESVLGRSVDTFSYPFGGRDATTIAAARDAGFEFACAAFPETICEKSQRYELPRFDVKDWSAEGFARRLERWFKYL